MSKHENDRTPGKYDVLQASKELAAYTLRITSNEKNFPKRYRFSIVGKLQDKAMEIMNDLIMANEIYPNTGLELERRLLYQKEAAASCRTMMTLMEIAAETFGVNAGTLNHWTGMTRDVRNHIVAWIRADKNRFKDLYRGTDC